MAIQLQYRKLSMDKSAPWSCYGQANRVTKDMRKWARDVNKDRDEWWETRYVDTKKNPELVL